MHAFTHGWKLLVGRVVSHTPLWSQRPLSFRPISAAQWHKISTKSLKLSNKSTAVWIIKTIQTVQIIFFSSKRTWHTGQELVESNMSNKSGTLLAKLTDGTTKIKYTTAYSKLPRAHCTTVMERIPICVLCNTIIIAVNGWETNYTLDAASCRYFKLFHLLLPGQKLSYFCLLVTNHTSLCFV